MALAGELGKYIGGELVKNTGKEIATTGAKSALANLIADTGTKAVAKATKESILNSLVPSTARKLASGVELGSEAIPLFRGQTNRLDRLDYNKGLSPNSNGFFMTPNKGATDSWAGKGVVSVNADPNDIMTLDELRSLKKSAERYFRDPKYQMEIYNTNPTQAEIYDALEAGDSYQELSRLTGKPFIERDGGQGTELGEIVFFPDTTPELTSRYNADLASGKNQWLAPTEDVVASETSVPAGTKIKFDKDLNIKDIEKPSRGRGWYADNETNPHISQVVKQNGLDKYLGEPKASQSLMELSPEQLEFFKDSVVRDENGELIPMYHGTRGDFTIFGEKNPSSSSNSKSGVGFWFTPSEEGAKNFASSIWYGDGEPKAMKTYLNMKNPKVYESVDNSKAVEALRKKLDKIELKSKTMSKPSLYYKNMYDYSVAYNMVNQGDKDMAIKWLADKSSYDEKTATELIEEIDNMKMLEDEKKRIQDEISELKYGDAYERFRTDIYKVDGQTAEDANVGGIGMALRDDSSVQKYVDNLKAEGYDGIIIKGTKYDSDTMGGVNDQYVAFYPEQIKNVDNKRPTKNKDIRYAIAAALGIGSIIGPYMNSQKNVDNIK